MNDLSFIRLEDSFLKAKNTRNSPTASIIYNDAIQLLPNETYVQVTNTTNGISFDGNYRVEVVNCSEFVLADITDNVAIEQFTDANGVPQIKFEITNVGVDFYKKSVFLKFTHTVSNYRWYSNPIVITAYLSQYTTRFDYMNYDGTDIMRSIRLGCWFDVNDAESSSSQYTTINGKKVTSRLILTEFEKYKFDRIDNFTYRRLNNMLSNSVIYVNDYRMTDKVVTASKDRAGDTNNFMLDFKIAIDYSESYTSSLQIFEPLEVVLYPLDNRIYTPTLTTPFTATFNRNISITDATIKARLYRNDVLVETVTPTVLGYVMSLPFTYTITNAEYYINVDADKITSNIGEIWQGVTSSTEWNFSIVEGEFESTEFETTEFLTN